ncbi:MAG TPA: NAD(P)-dependent oxidoreductase, partial [Thermoanaerobaculia bacterium]|nr:NAD(P)-dependent oxidoreductase [Thermoanaerobaculia bacterium]
MPEPLAIAFIGLGAMGTPMARRLIEAGYRLAGYDVRSEAVARLVAAGGRGASSAAEAAQGAGVLILMVVSADQADAVLASPGVLEGLAADATVVVMATCAPARIEAMSAKVAATGRAFVDAPVSGGIVGAEAGTLTIMAAAPAPVMQRLRPVLATMGSALFHVGERPGQGAAMKIVNQLLCGVHIAVAAEGLAFAERAGIDPAMALQILGGSAASSWMLKNRGPRMITDEGEVASAVDIFVKDLGLVLDAGRAERMGLPLAAAAHQLFLAASGMGHGARDDSQVIETYRALAPHTPA